MLLVEAAFFFPAIDLKGWFTQKFIAQPTFSIHVIREEIGFHVDFNFVWITCICAAVISVGQYAASLQKFQS